MRQCPTCGRTLADGESICSDCSRDQVDRPAYGVSRPPEPVISGAPPFTCVNCGAFGPKNILHPNPANYGAKELCPDCGKRYDIQPPAVSVPSPRPAPPQPPPPAPAYGVPRPAPPPQPLRECAACHRHANPEATTCPHCGAPMPATRIVHHPREEKTAYGLPRPLVVIRTVGNVALAMILIAIIAVVAIGIWWLLKR